MTRSINGKSELLREMITGRGIIELPGCYDVLSAMLLEEAGFETVFLSGYGVAASQLGNPDIGLTSLTETALASKNVAAAVDLPIIVDADNGYGNEDNVIRTIFELEYAGAAGCVIEDQVLPKRCGHTANKKILPLPLYMRKLECALRARQTPLVVVARTDSMDLDDAIERANTFHKAGADVTLIDGLRSMDAIKRVVDEVPGPKQINLIGGGVTPLLSAPELLDLGFKIVLYSTPALFVVAKAMRESLKRLRESHDLKSIGEESIGFRDFQGFMERRYRRRAHAGSIFPPALLPEENEK